MDPSNLHRVGGAPPAAGLSAAVLDGKPTSTIISGAHSSIFADRFMLIFAACTLSLLLVCLLAGPWIQGGCMVLTKKYGKRRFPFRPLEGGCPTTELEFEEFPSHFFEQNEDEKALVEKQDDRTALATKPRYVFGGRWTPHPSS